MAKVAERVSFPNQPTKAAASSEIILHQVSERVNLRVQNQTQTKQFMQWFGDWQRHTKDVSKIQNADGSPIAPVVIDGFARQNNVLIDSNAVTSVHGRKNAVTRLLADALDDYANGETSLFYWDKEKATTLLRRARVAMPKVSVQIHSGYIASIRDAGSPVKPKMKNVTESVQFKRWFGNWIENPEKASKIVNADGSPKIVYYKAEDAHGNIHLLDTENGGEAVYLNMRNPYRVKQKPNAQAEAQLIQYAKSEGYDGIIIPDSTSERYITFKQENIKSVDNVGTFDRGNADIRYSAKKKAAKNGSYDFSKSFAQQIDDWIAGRFPKGDALVLGDTPEVLQKIGLDNLPMTINQKHVGYVVNGTKNADHAIGADMLKQLPSALKDPIAIIASETHAATSIVVLLPMVHQGNQIIAPIYINGKSNQNGIIIDTNLVASVHGRKNAISRLLANAVEKEASGNTAIYFWNREKAIALLQYARDTMPKITALMPQVRTASAAAANISDGYVHSIYDEGSPVKARYSIMKSRSAQSYESEIERLKKQRDEAKRQIKLSKYQQVSPAGIKRMAQDLLAECRSTANADELTSTLNKSDSFLNQTCFFNLRYTVRYMVEKLAAPPSRLEIGSARKTPLTPSPAKCGRRSVSGMTTMPFRKMEKKMA